MIARDERRRPVQAGRSEGLVSHALRSDDGGFSFGHTLFATTTMFAMPFAEAFVIASVIVEHGVSLGPHPEPVPPAGRT